MKYFMQAWGRGELNKLLDCRIKAGINPILQVRKQPQGRDLCKATQRIDARTDSIKVNAVKIFVHHFESST